MQFNQHNKFMFISALRINCSLIVNTYKCNYITVNVTTKNMQINKFVCINFTVNKGFHKKIIFYF
jgi:hypothetical protein